MGDRYQEDLKAIVGVDELLEGLDDAAIRAQIPGKRGIGYVDSSGNAAGVSGNSGETTAPDRSDGNNSNGQSSESVGGSEGGDPQDGVLPQTDNVVSADGLLNINELKIGDTLKELEASDCDSGLDMNLRFDGNFPAPNETLDDDGNILNIAWDSPTDAPQKVGWTSGLEWTIVGIPSGSVIGNTPGSAVDAAILDLDANPVGDDVGNTYRLDVLEEFGINFTATITVDTSPTGTRQFSLFVTQASCTPSEESETCPIDAPTEEYWPVNGELEDTFYMAFIDGEWVYNEFDSQVPNNFQTPHGAIEFCFGSGQFGKTVPTADGGYAIYETATQGGDILSGTSAKIFNSAGLMIASVPADSLSDYIATTTAT